MLLLTQLPPVQFISGCIKLQGRAWPVNPHFEFFLVMQARSCELYYDGLKVLHVRCYSPCVFTNLQALIVAAINFRRCRRRRPPSL